MLIDASVMHPLNAFDPMLVTPLGIEMLVKETSDWKADALMFATELPRVTEDSRGLLPIAKPGMLATLFPITTVTRFAQLSSEPPPMLVTLSGIVTVSYTHLTLPTIYSV